MPTLTVYCSSSSRVDAVFHAEAEAVGARMAEAGYSLMYGGGDIGLMGRVARAVHAHGGHVIGVIPEALREVEGVAYEACDELIITQTMQERKSILFTRTDGFLVLPGGFGTLEEFLEVLTLKQLHYHDLPIVVLNTNGFYDPMVTFFEHLYATRFARPNCRSLYHVAASIEDAMAYLAAYQPINVGQKW
ncbi:MAG: TIGR00730 family Rossman fold protein [Bacteroidota bacterium]